MITHTFALMRVSRQTFTEIRDKLIKAGYDGYVDGNRIMLPDIALEEDIAEKPSNG